MNFLATLLPLIVALASPSSAQVVNYQPETLVSSNGLLEVTLNVDLLESLNGTRIAPAYNGAPVGPTLRLKPGDTLKVTLNNNLEPGTDLDRELNAFIMDPQNTIDDEANVTTIYNRLSVNGNVHDPTYGFWGQNFMNLHFHGAGFPWKEENPRLAIDGGETKTYTFQVPEDADPKFMWYHNHVHGTASYSYLSSLFGMLIIEGTDRDITSAPGIEGATEVVMIMSEGLVNEDKSVPPYFPIVFEFDWNSVTNGILGEMAQFEFTAGEKILFRVVSATVEPTINLSIPGVTFIIVAYDGFPLPEPKEVASVKFGGGSRVEFLVQFDEPGTYVLDRAGWNANIGSVEACTAVFAAPVFPCISYGISQVAAVITILPTETPGDAIGRNTATLLSEIELPAFSETLVRLAEKESVAEKTVLLEQALTYPIFQVPWDGIFVPPGVGFGVNGQLMNPYGTQGEVTVGTCETWTVSVFPPFSEHPFHAHAAKFMVTHEDGVEVDAPFWRDTYPVYGFNFTAHICFDDTLEEGDYLLTHCHMPNHLDIGMGTFYDVVAAAEVPEPEPEEPEPEEPEPEEPEPEEPEPEDPTSLAVTMAMPFWLSALLAIVSLMIW